MDDSIRADYIVTAHAASEMRRRGLSEEVVQSVVESPEQSYPVRTGRLVLQAIRHFGDESKSYLVRVFVDIERHPFEVVTAYRTIKIEKYWRRQP